MTKSDTKAVQTKLNNGAQAASLTAAATNIRTAQGR